MLEVKIAWSFETLLLHFLDRVATPIVSLIYRQWRQVILSTAHLNLAPDVARRAVTVDQGTFIPNVSIWEGCALHKTNLCSFLPAIRNTETSTETLIPHCLRGFRSISFFLSRCCGVAEYLCHFKVSLETSAHSQPAAALPLTQHGCFIYPGATLTCLFNWWSVCCWLW